MAIRLGEVAKAYFVRKNGGAVPTRRLNDVKRQYMMTYIGSGVSAQTPLNQLEEMWAKKVVATAGMTPAVWVSDLWDQMVLSISKTPAKNIQQNQLIFYSNAS